MVQVEVGGTPGPLSVVVQVVLEDGGVLLEMSIHPQQANAATITSARRMLLRLVRIVLHFNHQPAHPREREFTASAPAWRLEDPAIVRIGCRKHGRQNESD